MYIIDISNGNSVKEQSINKALKGQKLNSLSICTYIISAGSWIRYIKINKQYSLQFHTSFLQT